MFAIDSKFYRFSEFLYKIVLLNILFFVTSLPIVTIPSSLAALFEVIREEDGKVVAPYLYSFKKNLLRTLPFGAFNLCSLLFGLTLQNNVNIQSSLFLRLLLLVFLAFLITYNINLYVTPLYFNSTSSYYTLFRINFIVSISLFYKVVWIILLFGGIYYYLFPIVGGIINLFSISVPLYFYHMIYKKSLQQ